MIETEVYFNGIAEDEKLAESVKLGCISAMRAENAQGDITAELTNDDVIHGFNLEYRGVDRPTDVLSFPCFEGEMLISPPDGHLGDIMISVETAERQARELGHSLCRELTFLAIHGTLHILGFDHMEPEDEEIMTAEQRRILADILENNGGVL